MDNPIPQYPPRGSRPRPEFANGYGRLSDTAVITRSDIPFSKSAKLGWAMASRTVWPDDVLLNPTFALYLGRLGYGKGETMVTLLPWLALAAIALASREAIFTGPTAPGFAKEYGFWFSVGCIQAMLAPMVGIGQVGLLARAFGRYLPQAMREELSLCPNVRARDLVYGVGARLAAANGLGVLLWLLIIIGTSHYYLMPSVGQFPMHGLGMVVLDILLLYGAYTTRVFSDHGVAVATRSYFLLPDTSAAGARSIRDYFLWGPIVFLLAPVTLIGALLILLGVESIILGGLLVLLFPVIMGSLAAGTEQRAARVLTSTAMTLQKVGLTGGDYRRFTPPKMSERWPE